MMSLHELVNEPMKEKRKGLFPSLKKKSKSLDNIHQYTKTSPHHSPNQSPRPSLKNDSTLDGQTRFKGIKKKLQAFSLSKSNSNLLDQNGGFPESKKLHSAYSGSNLVEGKSPKDMRKTSPNVKDEMRKKSRLNDNFVINQPHPPAADQVDGNRLRSSTDLTDHFVVVDTVGYDDSYEETYDETDFIGPAELTTQEIERLQKKLDKTREELIRMQATKDENVKEYLKTADISESASNLKTKMNFEKSNQKTNSSIQILQKKLEKYQQQLKELEERGIHGPRRIIRVVQDSVRSGASSISGAVSKPLESLNQFIKKDKKDCSGDNISITITQNDDGIQLGSNTNLVGNNFSQINGINNSDEENVSLSSSNHLLGMNQSVGDIQEKLDTRGEQIEMLEKNNFELNSAVKSLKEELDHVVQSLQSERYKTEHLQNQLEDMFNQWNDLTELHQNEMMGLKQEMDRTAERIECVEYRFSERSEEIEEAVDTCATRITKMELQQHQHQQLLLSVDYFDGSGNTKILLSKVLSLIISIFAILLVVITTIAKIVMPFASTRMRVVTSVISLATLILLWKNSDHETVQALIYYINKLFGTVYRTPP